MLINAFDLETSSGNRSIELRVGEFSDLGIDVDLLGVETQANPRGVPVKGSQLDHIQQSYGLHLDQINRAIDLNGSLVNSWVSADLSAAPEIQNQSTGTSHFKRLAVIGGSEIESKDGLTPWTPLNRLFSLLAILPIQGIPVNVVAIPLLGRDSEEIEKMIHYPDLLKCCKDAFRHLPDLHRLIIFDQNDDYLRQLGHTIDEAIHRRDPHSMVVDLPPDLHGLDELRQLLLGMQADSTFSKYRIDSDLSELIKVLDADEISPISLGMLSRRLLERLVLASVQEATGRQPEEEGAIEDIMNLNTGIAAIRQTGADMWLVGNMHMVRIFGNWQCHPRNSGRVCTVEQQDIVLALGALRRTLAEYPWITTSSQAISEKSLKVSNKHH
ncbi:DUF4145 domain-containing protein [Synechococcus sp. BS56D]|uniref:DUF4145 domain-containing protein n=1 Tax=Synechococcus sp. BS56D TaxID=2055944 RepID=UPI00103948BD|nr:DUF4145 domain-containing protein [Synechococcus sp. BS56D]